MFTKTEVFYCGNGKVRISAHCLSEDTKETAGIANGSTCIEMDTSTLFFFDETNNIWRAWS